MTKNSKKGCKSAVYNIFAGTAPVMPKPGKGTEVVKTIMSKISKDMREPLVPMAMPIFASHIMDVKFVYSDNSTKELCGQMAQLIGVSGIGKGQLTGLVKAITKSSIEHDKGEYAKLAAYSGRYPFTNSGDIRSVRW